jgi:mono/diheme cytochrome c family protein
VLRLTRQPDAFVAAAAASGELSPRVTAVLDRIEWPGKPGARAPLVPLTPAEEARFNAGRETYRNICQACHQPDGRGQDRLAPALVGSALALAAPEIPARILLAGKEGPVGLMPPLGSTLSDEDVANVLTYIRREWGQPGSAVTPEQIRAVRAQTADRTRPWSNDELVKMLGK